MLTLEEQERAAYISGDIATAELLAHCIEGDAAEARIVDLEERIADLEESLGMT